MLLDSDVPGKAIWCRLTRAIEVRALSTLPTEIRTDCPCPPPGRGDGRTARLGWIGRIVDADR